MSAYCLDCGIGTTRAAGGTLVIRHAPTCPNRRSGNGDPRPPKSTESDERGSASTRVSLDRFTGNSGPRR